MRIEKGISDNDLENVNLNENPLTITQQQKKSNNLNIVTEDKKKDVIAPFESSSKRETFYSLNISFPWGYKRKKFKLLLSTFRNNSIPSRKIAKELVKIYPSVLFIFYYLEQYWVFDISWKSSWIRYYLYFY